MPLSSSWMPVLWPVKVTAIFRPRGGMPDGCRDTEDPVHKAAAILVLRIGHLQIHPLPGPPPVEDSSLGAVALEGVTGVSHLLGELGHREGPLLLTSTLVREQSQAVWEGRRVACRPVGVSTELAKEAEAGGDTAPVAEQGGPGPRRLLWSG